MGKKYLLTIDGEQEVHAFDDDEQNEGMKCSYKEDEFDEYYDTVQAANSKYPDDTEKYKKEFSRLWKKYNTTKPVSCKMCIRSLERKLGFVKRDGKWY